MGGNQGNKIMTFVKWYKLCKNVFQSMKHSTNMRKLFWFSLTPEDSMCTFFTTLPSVICRPSTHSHTLTRWSLHIQVMKKLRRGVDMCCSHSLAAWLLVPKLACMVQWQLWCSGYTGKIPLEKHAQVTHCGAGNPESKNWEDGRKIPNINIYVYIHIYISRKFPRNGKHVSKLKWLTKCLTGNV